MAVNFDDSQSRTRRLVQNSSEVKDGPVHTAGATSARLMRDEFAMSDHKNVFLNVMTSATKKNRDRFQAITWKKVCNKSRVLAASHSQFHFLVLSDRMSQQFTNAK